MRREILELIDRVRELGIKITPTEAQPHAIRLAGERTAFPQKLYRVAEALDAVDRSGAATRTAASIQDAARLRSAIDGLFSWMKAADMDVTEAHAVVAASLGVRPRPQPQNCVVKASLPPPLTQRPVPYRLLRLMPELGDRVSMASLMARASAAAHGGSKKRQTRH